MKIYKKMKIKKVKKNMLKEKRREKNSLKTIF